MKIGTAQIKKFIKHECQKMSKDHLYEPLSDILDFLSNSSNKNHEEKIEYIKKRIIDKRFSTK